MGIDPQETLAQGNKRRHLNPIGSKMLQLHLVIIQQPPKDSMRGNSKSPLMEDSKRYDIPFGRRRCLLLTRQQPLRDGKLRAEKAMADKALQTPRGNAGSTPQLH